MQLVGRIRSYKSGRGLGINAVGRTDTKHLQTAMQAIKLTPELYVKHFKKNYSGLPTKRYLKLTQKIRESERFGFPDVVRYIMGK
jgi:hypothetical protein